MNHGPAEDFYVHLDKVAPRVWAILHNQFQVADGDMVDRDLASGSTVADVFDNTTDEVVRFRIVMSLRLHDILPPDPVVRRGSDFANAEERWWAARLAETLE